MGEMPSFSAESKAEAKDSKKFETPKTRAQKEAEKSAKQMEGGTSSDNPSGSASQSDDYMAFLQQMMGAGASGTVATGKSTDSEHSYDPQELNIDLPGAVSKSSSKFSSPDEEINKLKAEIAKKAKELNADNKTDLARVANKELLEYSLSPTQNVLDSDMQMPSRDIMREVLKLESEDHDEQIEKLLRLTPYRGVKNVLSIVKKINNPHLEDDFHRALVQYLIQGLPVPQLKVGTELWRELNMVLYEVSLGTENPTEQEQGIQQQKVRDLDRLLKTMEQFYSGMISVAGKDDFYSVELAKPIGKEELMFFVAVPRSKKELFERHLGSVYPDSVLKELKGDYNVFNYNGAYKMAYVLQSKHFSAPLKDYKHFSHDPLNIILGAFSGLDALEEGAAVQFVIKDEGAKHNDFVQKVITNMRKNKPFKKAVKHAESPSNVAKDELKKHFKEMMFGKDNRKPDPVDEALLEQLGEKAKSRILAVNMRIASSARTQDRAKMILENISSTFNQFENPRVNNLSVKTVAGKEKSVAAENFIFRRPDSRHKALLSISELSTIMHLTAAGVRSSRELKQNRSKKSAAPVEISVANQKLASKQSKGIILGKNVYGAKEYKVPFLEEDRMRHFYEIGQTGTGKTYLMKSMIIQDIYNGEGVCYIDPHGTDIVDILAAIPPERADDLIYFDPSYTARPYGLNILEWNPEKPDEKTFVTNELYEIFVKLFGDVPESLGPMFQQYYRNATLLVLEGQEAGKATMADIPKVFADKEFRHKMLENSKNPIVNQFWVEIAEKAGGDASLENVTPYITAKTDTFLANEIMRPIVSQEKTTINFREVMDKRKILLVNLSKGRIGELNAQLLGLIIVGKFLQAALARVESLDLKSLAPFYLYIDEFQNFTTPSIATILSEARKYRLSLNLAHQFIKQLDDKIKDAVFGNVGSKCVFRVSPEDAEFLEKSFAPEFTAKDIASVENYNAYLSLLVNGSPVKPFSMETITYNWNLDYEYAEKLRQLSFLKYGRPREEIEEEILKKYMPNVSKQDGAPPPLPWM